MSSSGHNSNSKTKANVQLLYYLRLPSQMAIGKVKRGNERLRDFYENCYVCEPHRAYTINLWTWLLWKSLRMQTTLHIHYQSIGQHQIQTQMYGNVTFAKIFISNNRPFTYATRVAIHSNATAPAANDLENLFSIPTFIRIIFLGRQQHNSTNANLCPNHHQ